mmetsp:Transcript_2407/g.6210  ORF Transcript_2407/g.6210 Transcript_2407/m.6210 type:complete len:100 (-) Transcript_2407:115-414(-)
MHAIPLVTDDAGAATAATTTVTVVIPATRRHRDSGSFFQVSLGPGSCGAHVAAAHLCPSLARSPASSCCLPRRSLTLIALCAGFFCWPSLLEPVRWLFG